MDTRKIFEKVVAESEDFRKRYDNHEFKNYAQMAEVLGEPFDEKEREEFMIYIEMVFARRRRIIDSVIELEKRYGDD